MPVYSFFIFFFFNDTATTEIYTLSLHDALPTSIPSRAASFGPWMCTSCPSNTIRPLSRSEEHTSELQSRRDLVCRLLLEKKKITFSFVVTFAPSTANHFVHLLHNSIIKHH